MSYVSTALVWLYFVQHSIFHCDDLNLDRRCGDGCIVRGRRGGGGSGHDSCVLNRAHSVSSGAIV